MSKERLAEAHWVLERQLAWVAAAEVKVGVIATLQIALLGGLGVAYSTATARSPWAVGFSVFCAVADVASLICASMAIVPRMRGPKASLVFFGRIAERGKPISWTNSRACLIKTCSTTSALKSTATRRWRWSSMGGSEKQ